MHSRLSAVSFQPRETLDLSVLADPSGSKSISSIIGFHESNPTDFTNKKVQTSHTPDPELPFCIASTRLFAACASGDANCVVTILSEISSGKDQDKDKDKDKDNNFCDISSGNSNSEHVLDTVLQEQWDMSEILNMPNSLESLATCLHIASESGVGCSVTDVKF